MNSNKNFMLDALNLLGKGFDFLDTKQYTAALVCFKETLVLCPNDRSILAQAWRGSGMAYEYLGFPRKALICFSKSIRFHLNIEAILPGLKIADKLHLRIKNRFEQALQRYIR